MSNTGYIDLVYTSDTYTTVTMGKYTARVRKRWIRYNITKQTIEESSDREEWTQAEEVPEKKEELDYEILPDM